MSEISKKKQQTLYDLLHRELMDARVKIKMKLSGVVHHTISNEVDDILSDLVLKMPDMALESITTKRPDGSGEEV